MSANGFPAASSITRSRWFGARSAARSASNAADADSESFGSLQYAKAAEIGGSRRRGPRAAAPPLRRRTCVLRTAGRQPWPGRATARRRPGTAAGRRQQRRTAATALPIRQGSGRRPPRPRCRTPSEGRRPADPAAHRDDPGSRAAAGAGAANGSSASDSTPVQRRTRKSLRIRVDALQQRRLAAALLAGHHEKGAATAAGIREKPVDFGQFCRPPVQHNTNLSTAAMRRADARRSATSGCRPRRRRR